VRRTVDGSGRRVAEDEAGDHGPSAAPGAAPGSTPINRRKSRKAADAERRERHRLAEERIEAERAQRRADNRAARERDAAERAERQRVADAERENARRQDEERLRREVAGHLRRTSGAGSAGVRSAPVGADDEAIQAARRAEAARQAEEAKAAARERKRRVEAERRAARAERARRQAEEKAERRRQQEEERRAEREADHARARGADPYAILGIASNATVEEVARAYRRLARTHHPDLNQEGTPQERAAREAEMKRVNVAYGLLGDSQRRKAYDRLHRRS